VCAAVGSRGPWSAHHGARVLDPGLGARNRRNPPKIAILAPWGGVAAAPALFRVNNYRKNDMA